MRTTARRIDPHRASSSASHELTHLAGLGFVAASLAHEVRGPVTALGLLVPELTAEVEALPGRAREDLAPILADMATCAQQLVKLCAQVSRASRPDDAPELLDLSEVAADAVSIARVHARGLRLRLVESYEAAPISGARGRLTQAILNLMLNAIEACRSIAAEAHRIEVTVELMRDAAVLTVSDSGPGLAEGAATRAFDRFFTTRPGKVGLGLALARECMEAHDGEIELRRDPRGGTTVVVTLPRADPPEPTSTPWPL